MNTQTLELDLSKDGLGTNLVRVGQGDKGGTTLKALIYDGGAEAALTGFTGYLEVLLPNKANYYRAAATISGNAATVTVDESKLCSIPGYTDEAYFAFEKNGVRYSTERFAIEILKCATAGQQPAQSWDDAIDSLINRGNAAVSSANSAAASANSAASAANAAAERVETAVTNAEAATTAANSAASEANAAAQSATSAASSANSAASSATSAASSASSAATSANSAATAANAAAERVETAIESANSAAAAANDAAGAANTAKANADIAAADAHSAAEDARDATKRALNVIGSGGGGSGGGGASSADIDQLKKDNATLARALCDATDEYIVIDGICYVPASRGATVENGVLSIPGATYADNIITLV